MNDRTLPSPLKAERIQLVIAVISPRSDDEDPKRPDPDARRRRVLAGWRRRTAEPPWRPRSHRRVA